MHPDTLNVGPRSASAGTGADDSAPVSGPDSSVRAEAGRAAVASGSARRGQAGPEASSDAPDPPPGSDVCDTKASAAWKALNNRYRSSLSQAEIDHLHARFVVGLTQPRFGEGPPTAHLEACRRLLARDLPPERVEAVLNDSPPPAEAWLEEAFERIESQGERIGRGIANGHGAKAAADGGSAAGS